MKALVKAKAEPGLWLEERPVPSVGPFDALVKVNKTGICGTDIHIYNWDEWAQRTIPVPLVVGHEYSGVIAELGANVKGLSVGQRVSGEGHVTGTHSRAARGGRFHMDPETKGIGVNIPGAFAEYLALPAFNIVPLPDDVDDEMGAILDPLGNAVHTALAFDLAGEDVLITGAGPIGLMAIAICRHVGARNIVITDVNDYRLDLARKMGATRAVRADRQTLRAVMDEIDMHEGFDVGLEMSGNPRALRDMIGSMNNGAKVALLGILADEAAIDWNQVIFKGLTLKGIYGREMYETWYKMLAMLQSGLDVTPVITHRLPMAEYEKGFAALNAGQACKVVLDFNA